MVLHHGVWSFFVLDPGMMRFHFTVHSSTGVPCYSRLFTKSYNYMIFFLLRMVIATVLASKLTIRQLRGWADLGRIATRCTWTSKIYVFGDRLTSLYSPCRICYVYHQLNVLDTKWLLNSTERFDGNLLNRWYIIVHVMYNEMHGLCELIQTTFQRGKLDSRLLDIPGCVNASLI